MADWKQSERDTAAWIDGRRYMSAGVEHMDVSNHIREPGQEPAEYPMTIEHKARQHTSFPLWLLKGFDQRRVNLALYPGVPGFVVVSVHYGHGNPTRRFLMTEVDFKNDRYSERVNELMHARSAIEQLIAKATSEEAA